MSIAELNTIIFGELGTSVGVTTLTQARDGSRFQARVQNRVNSKGIPRHVSYESTRDDKVFLVTTHRAYSDSLALISQRFTRLVASVASHLSPGRAISCSTISIRAANTMLIHIWCFAAILFQLGIPCIRVVPVKVKPIIRCI